MKTLGYLNLAVVSLIVLSVAAWQTCPAAEKDEGKPDWFADIPKSELAGVREIEAKHPDLVESWVALREAQAEIVRLTGGFGVELRKKASKDLAKLAEKEREQRTEFMEALDEIDTPLSEAESKAKDRAFTLDGMKETDASANKERNERIAGLYKEAQRINTLRTGLSALRGLVSRGPEAPTHEEQIGIDRHDRILQAAAQANPELVAARIHIKDLQADIQALERRQAEKTGWSYNDKRDLESRKFKLTRAVGDLEKMAGKAKDPLVTDMTKLDRKIEQVEGRVASGKKRGRSTDRHEEELSTLQTERRELEQTVAAIDKLAQWKEPEKEGAPKKRAGH